MAASVFSLAWPQGCTCRRTWSERAWGWGGGNSVVWGMENLEQAPLTGTGN